MGQTVSKEIPADMLMNKLIGGLPATVNETEENDVIKVVKSMHELAQKEKEKFSKNFHISIHNSEYQLPYNWIFSKVGAYETLTEEVVEDLMTKLLNKIRFDLLEIATQKVKNQALIHGDSDISV